MLSVLGSCNKSEFEDVFNGENSDAIAPDVLWDHYDDSSVLFEPSEKSKHYLEHYIISMVNGGQWRDTAFVVNSVAELPDYVMESIGFGMQAPFYKYHVSIYPKLSSTVVRSRNWHVPIPEFK